MNSYVFKSVFNTPSNKLAKYRDICMDDEKAMSGRNTGGGEAVATVC